MSVCVCACVRACVCACVRACVRACVHVCAVLAFENVQCYYLHEDLRRLLREKKGVVGFEIIQCLGDAIFIPAGAPHQVRALRICVEAVVSWHNKSNVVSCHGATAST